MAVCFFAPLGKGVYSTKATDNKCVEHVFLVFRLTGYLFMFQNWAGVLILSDGRRFGHETTE